MFDIGVGGVIGCGGDLASQAIERHRTELPRPHDRVRTHSVVIYGAAAALPYQCGTRFSNHTACQMGSPLHPRCTRSYWYRGLAYLFPDGTRGMVLKKLVCELGLAIPRALLALDPRT